MFENLRTFDTRASNYEDFRTKKNVVNLHSFAIFAPKSLKTYFYAYIKF